VPVRAIRAYWMAKV